MSSERSNRYQQAVFKRQSEASYSTTTSAEATSGDVNLETTSTPQDAPRNCAFFLPKKQRLCRFPAANNRRFCGAHAHLEQDDVDGDQLRIPCPYDPNHTVFVKQLEKHKLRCNSRPVEGRLFESKYVNAGSNGASQKAEPEAENGSTKNQGLSQYSDDEVVVVIRKVLRAFQNLPHEAKQGVIGNCTEEDILPSQLSRSVKHSLQQAALTDLLKEHCLAHLHSRNEADIGETSDETTKRLRLDASLTSKVVEGVIFVEFGAGGGGWSHYLWSRVEGAAEEEVDDDSARIRFRRVNFLLIDRETVRNKYDKRGIRLSQPDGCQISRVRVDIEHLLLHEAPLVAAEKNDSANPQSAPQVMVAISKHLCGDATDLTLRCLLNYAKKMHESCGMVQLPPLQGVVIALCCHHRCTLAQYCNWPWLQKSTCGNEEDFFIEREFQILVRLTGWATCFGAEVVETAFREHEDILRKSIVESGSDAKHILDILLPVEKVLIGRRCKRLIDWGRLLFIRENMPGASSACNLSLNSYCSPQVTLENIVLIFSMNHK